MKKLKVMMMTLMMCLVSVSVWGQDIESINTNTSNNITKTINTNDTILCQQKIEVIIKDYKLDVIIDGVSKSYNLYNLQGIDVTKLNGSLISGVYIVVINDKYIGKIFVK